MNSIRLALSAAMLTLSPAVSAQAAGEDADDTKWDPLTREARHGCREAVRKEAGKGGIRIDHAEFSQANSLIMLTDGSGQSWRCLSANDGTVAELTLAGASSVSDAEPGTTTQRVHFGAGSTGATIAGVLEPGASANYVLGAKAGQDLTVEVEHRAGPRLDYQIFNPDGSALPDMISTDKVYGGELMQSGDHVVEVVNRGGKAGEYAVHFGIR